MQEQTGLLHVPSTPPPPAGRPFVVYGHMTTGGSRRSAPSLGDPTHPEWRRMSQGDALCALLLDRGIAVLRPDYEGIGGDGIHPYLIGSSLAESMHAMVRARHSFDIDLGDAWVAAGHSEGAVAALHASVTPGDGALLRGTAAFAPVTRMDVSIGLSRRIGVRFPGSGVVSALIGLMLRGAATGDERMRALLSGDGLSPAASERWRDLDRLCLTELAAGDSWGALAPGRIGGASGEELFALLRESFEANEVAALTGFRAPVRIDAARFDEVAPAPLSARLLRRYREAGVDLTSAWWQTHHSGTMHPQHAPSRAADWIAGLFTRGGC
ncbi:S9 family peptidase [Streptomyces sp. AC495_CC817]|uniref:alpha/beta hydrolase family protein n=1 Tax=Streptomyces sp. AC495_CC817 TaxID=2823900 RepID=UPI001C25E098|nr:lipase family protein [Streptomyces sp. AC495_CC817]